MSQSSFDCHQKRLAKVTKHKHPSITPCHDTIQLWTTPTRQLAYSKMTTQTTPQTSPGNDPSVERKKALELKLKLKKEALASMQERVFATQQEIQKLKSKKENRQLYKRVSQDTREEAVLGEISDSGSEWSGDEMPDSCWPRMHEWQFAIYIYIYLMWFPYKQWFTAWFLWWHWCKAWMVVEWLGGAQLGTNTSCCMLPSWHSTRLHWCKLKCTRMFYILGTFVFINRKIFRYIYNTLSRTKCRWSYISSSDVLAPRNASSCLYCTPCLWNAFIGTIIKVAGG